MVDDTVNVIDFHDGQTFDDWAFKNKRLVHWLTAKLVQTHNVIHYHRIDYDQVFGFVLEGMWQAWPKYDGRTKLSNFLVFCGRRWAIRWMNLEARAWRQGDKQLSHIAHQQSVNLTNKSNSGGFLNQNSEQRSRLNPAAASRGALADEITAEEAEERRVALDAALMSLPERQRSILFLRHVDGNTFATLGSNLGVCKERARQLAEAAINQLRHRFFGLLEGT